MDVEAVRHRVGVEDVDDETVARPDVNHGAGHPMHEDRLIHIGEHQLIGLRHEVIRIEILAVHERG